MTQTSDSIRFRVVEGETTDTETLATEIYTTYVAPETADDPDEEPLQVATPDDRSGSEVTEPASVPPIAAEDVAEDADVAEDTRSDRQPQQRPLNLPTLPALPPLNHGTHAATPPTATVPSPDALSDEETTLLREVLHGKLTDTQIQRLIQAMQTATPEDTPRSHPTPLSPRTVNRHRLGALLLLLILLGVGSSLILNRTTGKGLLLPNAPDATASPTAIPSVAATPVPQLDATLTSRNVALDAALKESEGQRDALDRTRRDYLLALADAEVKRNGTPVEVWLIRRLNAQMLELRRALGQGGQFSGDAQQIATARALVGDARAILLALQQEWQTPNAAPGRHRIAPAILTKQMTELAELARMVREASYEQQLRDAEQSRHPEKNKTQEVPTNGVLPSP